MSLRVTLRILGVLLMVFSLTLVPPTLISLLFHDTVWDAFGTASQETLAQYMGDDLFKRTHDSVMESMKSSSGWIQKSTGAYVAQRDRVLG